MKADKSKMFAVPLKHLKIEEGAPFPLFLHLELSNRFVPIRLSGDPIGDHQNQKFRESQLSELWVPNEYNQVYLNYIAHIKKTDPPKEETAPFEADKKATKKEAKAVSEEAALARDVLEEESLSTEDKARLLSEISQDLLRALNQITTRGDEARSKGLSRCKELVDQVLIVASQDSNIYDEIISLRQSQEDIEHSVIVGTITVMFALAVGYTDEKILADLTVAAIFHDIGVVRVKPEVLLKKEKDWTGLDRKEYEGHVMASVKILTESANDFHPRIYRMIEEHHENYDGSGFPKTLKGSAIEESSQLLHMGNLFDRLCTGKQTGTALSPAEAFDYIDEVAQDPKAVQEIQPELVRRVFEFILSEKEAAETLKSNAQARVLNAVDAKAT